MRCACACADDGCERGVLPSPGTLIICTRDSQLSSMRVWELKIETLGLRDKHSSASGVAVPEHSCKGTPYLSSAPSDPHQEKAAPLFMHCTLTLLSSQYMAGGDLGSALDRDIMEHGPGEKRRLGWYKRGRVVLLCIARGLTYLHSERVRRATKLCSSG